jgi:hypothetical protein
MLKVLMAACVAATVLWYVDDQYCHGTYFRSVQSMVSLVVHAFS